MGITNTSQLMQKAAFRLALWQVAITSVVVVCFGWFGGTGSAFSAAAGGGIGIVAGLYQALKMFRVDASASPDRFMMAAYVGEAVKILLTVALFIAAIRIFRVEFTATMVAYAATYIAYWIALSTGYPWFNNDSAGDNPATRHRT